MICPKCKGAKTLSGLWDGVDATGKRIGGAGAWSCSTCNGTGEVTQEQNDDIVAGHKMREDRVGRGLSLRAEAERLGVPEMELAKMERGLVPVLGAGARQQAQGGAMPTIKELQATAHDIALTHGWWDRPHNDGEMLMLMVCELAEAHEAVRLGNPASEHIPQHSAFAEELADVVIYAMNLAHERQIDLERVLLDKIEFNRGRPHKHGKAP